MLMTCQHLISICQQIVVAKIDVASTRRSRTEVVFQFFKKTRKSYTASIALLVWIFHTEAIFLSAERRMATILILQHNKWYSVLFFVLFFD